MIATLGHLLLFVLALAALIKCADWMVEYAARIAKRFGVSDLIVGLTLTSVGTSIPELAAGIAASLENHGGLVIGNVVGSNIANIGLILAIAAIIRPFSTEAQMHERDGLTALAVVVMFFLMALDNEIARWEAWLMISLYAIYVSFLAHSDRPGEDYRLRRFISYFLGMEYMRPLAGGIKRVSTAVGTRMRTGEFPRAARTNADDEAQSAVPLRDKLWFALIVVVACCGGVAGSAHIVVHEASWIARLLSVPEAIIGISMIAVGTSLPELTVAVAAARKGNASMVIGNVVGSNIANILLVLAVSTLVRPLHVPEVSVAYTIPILLFFTIGFLYVVKSGRVTRIQGVLTLIGYLAFLALAIHQGWS